MVKKQYRKMFSGFGVMKLSPFYQLVFVILSNLLNLSVFSTIKME